MQDRLLISIEGGSLNIVRTGSQSARDFLILDLELEDLTALEPTDAAFRVGATVLNLLACLHPKDFGEWKVPPPGT